MRREFLKKLAWRRVSQAAAAGILVLLVVAAVPHALASTPGGHDGEKVGRRSFHARKRLILKDGSYQDVVRYRVRDGRVRYLSTERGGWEEMPASKVDWAATKRWNHEHPHGVPAGESEFGDIPPAEARREVAEIDREEYAQRLAAKELRPYVKPGLQLPDQEGIFALDEYRGLAELVHMEQADGDLNENPYHSVQAVKLKALRGFHDVVKMEGLRAGVQLHVRKPVFYVRVPGAPLPPANDPLVVSVRPGLGYSRRSDGGPKHRKLGVSHFVILRVVRRRGARVIFAEQMRRANEPDPAGNRIPTREKILPGHYWMKVTPVYALDRGEYALVELLSPKEVNRDVWAFGVDPKAAENQPVITPIEMGGS